MDLVKKARRRVATKNTKSAATIALCIQMVLSCICLPLLNFILIGFAVSGLSKPRRKTIAIVKNLCYFQGFIQMLLFLLVSILGTMAFLLIDCLRDFASFVNTDEVMTTSRRVLITVIILLGVSVINAVHAGRLCKQYESVLRAAEAEQRQITHITPMEYKISYPLQVMNIQDECETVV